MQKNMGYQNREKHYVAGIDCGSLYWCIPGCRLTDEKDGVTRHNRFHSSVRHDEIRCLLFFAALTLVLRVFAVVICRTAGDRRTVSYEIPLMFLR